MKRAKKFLAGLLVLSCLSGSMVACAAEQITSTDLQNARLAQVDLENISLTDVQRDELTAFNEGLADELRAVYETAQPSPQELRGNTTVFDDVISEYYSEHEDVLAQAMYDEAKKPLSKKALILQADPDTKAYRDYSQTFAISDDISVTFAPDAIYVDEYAEEPVSIESSAASSKSNNWKCKDVAARRTLMKKFTVAGKTLTMKSYAAHTGGTVKYNGSKARHSSGFYGYSTFEGTATTLEFEEIVSQSESYGGTSWRYKYLGKVSGKVSVTSPVKKTLTFKEDEVGCQITVGSSGSVTKKYWPSL